MTASAADPPVDVVRCPACRALYAARVGPCPRCGHVGWEPLAVPSEGVVIAATELAVPPPGWPVPHPLVLVEAAQGLRVLATAPAPVPAIGSRVRIRRDGDRFSVEALAV